MPPKPAVEKSPHYEEIIDLLLQNKSTRDISKYLKDEYGEEIGHNAINNYRRNHLKLDERVEVEANRILADQQDTVEQEDKEAIVEEGIKKKAYAKATVELSTQSVASELAEVMIGVFSVAKNFHSDYNVMKEKAKDPDSNITEKDVAQMSQHASKIGMEYSKSQDTNFEVNVNNLSAGFDTGKIRGILDAKRRRRESDRGRNK